MEEKPFLLFCNTFTHEGEGEDQQLDLVGFSRAIAISEVRVIPHGCKVHPEIRDRLGETTPSSFKLEFFLKNLTQPNATVFERLGVLDYEEGKSIQLVTSSNIPTNVVLLRGWYQNLTLCLYGNYMNFEDSNQIPPPPPPNEMQKPIPMQMEPVQVQTPANIGQPVGSSAPIPIAPVFIQTQGINNGAPPTGIPPHMEQMNFQSPNFVANQSPQEDIIQDHEFEYRRQGNDFRHNEVEEEREERFLGPFRDNRERFDDDRRLGGRREYLDQDDNFKNNREFRIDRKHNENNVGGNENAEIKENAATEEMFEPLSPASDFCEESQEECNKTKKEKEEIGYEDIESDEDLMLEDFDFDEIAAQGDFDTEEAWASVSLNFNPYQTTLTTLENTPSITETSFEKSLKQYKVENVKEPSQVKQLQDYIVQDVQADRDAKWVTMLEDVINIVPIAMSYLRSQPSQKMKEKHFLSFISEWAIYGLNMDKVRSLPLAVNIRFLKASLKLTCILGNACSEYLRMVIDEGVQKKLMALLEASHVASSIKLLILKALDATTSSAIGMEAFLGWNYQHSGKDVISSCYEEMILYLLTKPTARLVVAVKALLGKCHFYESLANMQSICSRISESPVKEEAVIKQEDKDEEKADEDNETVIETKKSVDLDISYKDVNDLILALTHIRQVLQDGGDMICQKKILLFPASLKLEEDNGGDNYPTVVKFLLSRRCLESLLIIISSPLFCEPAIYSAIRDIFFLLLCSKRGLLYLACDINSVNGVVRALLQSPSDTDIYYSDMPTLKQFMMADFSKEQCHPHHIGIMIVYYMQVLKEVDKLMKTARTGLSVKEMNSAENITVLHTLYSMTFTTVGLDAVISVLSYGENLHHILPFLNGDEEFETKFKKSVSSRYAAVICNLIFLHSNQVEYFQRFSPQLLAIPKKENDKVYEDLHSYIAPLEKIKTFDKHAIAPLLEIMNTDLDDFKYGSPSFKSVLVAIRILDHIASGSLKENATGKSKNLDQNLCVIQMFSSNCVDVFLKLYSKIAHLLLVAQRQKETLMNMQCYTLLSIIPYLLKLTSVLMTYLLETSYCFKDNRLIQNLLVLHKTLCSKPPSGYLASMLVKIQEDIVNLLLMFLRGTSKAPDSEEAVKSSTWYILYKETLAFAVEKPENFVSSLMLLSEFLPTPLPIHSLHDIPLEEMSEVLNHRLYAIANLSFLGNELKLFLKTVLGSCCSSLQYYLRRMCCQVVDLGAAVAKLIIRCLVELVNDALDKAKKDLDENNLPNICEDSKKRYLSNAVYSTFSLLSYLVCQPGGKIALLNLVTTTDECVTEYPDFIQKLIAIDEKEKDPRYLENNLLPFFQSLCDHEICIEQFDGVITLQHLANSVPPIDLLKPISEMLFTLLQREQLPIPIVLRVLGIIESLTDHDYGMQIIKKYLADKGECLNVFINRFINDVKNKIDLPAVYDAVSTFMEFLSLANSSGPENYLKSDVDDDIKTEGEPKFDNMKLNDKGKSDQIRAAFDATSNDKLRLDGKSPLQRTIFMNGNMMKKIFDIDEKNTNEHPLTKLEKLIEEESKNEEELISLSQSITTLRMIMIAAGEVKDSDIRVESPIELVPPDTLQTQFSSRLVTMVINNSDDERASSNDWFDAPPPEDVDSDAENEAVKANLIETCESYLSNFKLIDELEKGFIDTTTVKRSKRGKNDAFFKAGEYIEDTKRLRFDVSALNTAPSMRGMGRGANRGFTRGFLNNRAGFNRSTGRGFSRGFIRGRGRGRGMDPDAFRQRRQNTSRPPSMHVDDFVIMEKKGETVMAHSKQEQKEALANERYQSGTFNSPNTNGNSARWNSPNGGFRRPNDDYQQGNLLRNQGRDGYNNDASYNQRPYYNKFHNRSSSDWNNSNHSYRGSRDNNYSRPNTRGGGYWNNQKNKDDGRFFPGGSGYRGNRGGRHIRTFTR